MCHKGNRQTNQPNVHVRCVRFFFLSLSGRSSVVLCLFSSFEESTVLYTDEVAIMMMRCYRQFWPNECRDYHCVWHLVRILQFDLKVAPFYFSPFFCFFISFVSLILFISILFFFYSCFLREIYWIYLCATVRIICSDVLALFTTQFLIPIWVEKRLEER